jgi:protoporphyrinogen oxidase
MAELHRNVILGGGLTGLSVAFHMNGEGDDYHLFERESRPGGLAKTETVSGFSFDKTGHHFHAHDPHTRALLRRVLPGGLVRIPRRSTVYSHRTYTRYPFQANTFGLPPKVVKECVLGFLGAPARGQAEGEEPTNFEEWVYHRFGSGIARHFMIPYNEKLWGVPSREVTTEFCDRLVPQPNLEEVIAGAVGCNGTSGSESVSFLYPEEGGIETLSRALARRVRHMSCGREAKKIAWRDRFVAFADGGEVGYGRLVTTLPLPETLRRLSPAPPEAVRRAARALRHTSVLYLHYGVKGEAPHAHHWVYIPEKKFPFYRISFPSNVRADLAPAGHYSMTAEISHRGPVDIARIRERARAGLVSADLVRQAADVVLERAEDIPYAYVVFDDRYRAARETCLRWLADKGITGAGRYGRWTYASMEEALLEGRAVAERLRSGAEMTELRP